MTAVEPGPEKSSQALGTSLFWLCAAGILLIAVGLRLPMLASRPLWLDETYSAWFSALPLRELWSEVPAYETHPPLYYSLLKGWRFFFGPSEAGLRSFSVLASVTTVFLLSISGRLLRVGATGEAVSLIAGLLLAVNAGSIKYAQEARPYALETLAVTCALVASAGFVSAFGRHVVRPRAAVWAMALALSGGLLLWSHNTALFVAFGIWCALGVAILVSGSIHRGRMFALACLAGIGALLIWAPFLPWFIRQSQSFGAMRFWITPMPYDLASAWVLAGGGLGPAALALLLAGAGALALWQRHRPLLAGLCVVLVLPLSLVLTLSFLMKPIYLDRLFGWMAPPLMLLAACGIVCVFKSPPIRFVVCCVVLAASLRMVTQDYAAVPTEDFRALSTELTARARPGDIVIAIPNELNVAFDYYGSASRSPPVIYLPGPFPYLAQAGSRSHVGNLGAPQVIAGDVADLDERLAGYSRIWLVTRRSDLYDPDSLALTAVARMGRLAEELAFGLVKARLFERSPP
ncbi:hypothetical protein QTL95_25875 [Rhizobium sp. S152]|uniref:glycosyltransferase family 39 protein n=1 Tax=Rhizobium sp. S152 TaxID=3055038 RepID=UPI0025AA085C|nr:hypothetical protein [Rhizobium sp. S152]MDM9629321.1 hypothetical protein [Rhizobium sp. S152]